MRLDMMMALGLAAMLVGCTTMTPEERRAADEATCRSYGFKKKNDAFAACLQRIDLYRRAERRAEQMELWDGPWNGPWYGRPGIYYARPPAERE